ncbi:MAG: LPD38 domain-containing protein [Synergistaceae bacterium]
MPEKEDRLDAIRFMFHHLRQGGAGIITVYEGKGTGKMEKVTKGHRYNYQLNRKLEDYLPEVMEALPGNVAEIQKKYGAIIITKKKPLSMAELAEGLPGKPVQETLIPITEKMAAKEKPVKFRTKKPAYQEDMDDRLPETLESIDNRDPEKYKATTNSLKDDTGDKMMDRVVRKEKLVKMIDRIVPLYVGRVRGKRRVGFFKAKEELIRIKTEFFSDLDYLTHELGHFLDKELMLTRRKVMRMAMQKDLGNRAYDILTSELVNAPYVQEILLDLFPEADFKLQVHEGLADFIRAYIVEPTEAEKKFPNFFIYFERMLGLADGDITEKIGELRRAVALYINQPPEAMIASFVGSDEKERSSILSWYYKIVDEGGRIAYVVEQIIGDKRFWGKSPGGVDIISPNENPYLLYKVSRAFQSKAHLYVKHGQYTRDKNNKLKKEGPSLDEITRPIFELGKHENGVSHFDRWTYYMIAKRAIEIEDVKGLKSGMDKYQMQAARDFVDSIEGNKEKGIKRAEHADIYEEQFVKLVKFMHFNLRQLLDAGIIDGDTYDKIIKENEFYIPFYRVRSDRSAKKAEGQHLGNTPKGVYRYRGASLPIYNPWDSILRQVFIYTALADKNKAINALVDMAEKWEGTGQYFAKIPAPMQVTATTLGEVLAGIGIHISDEIALEKLGEAIAEEAGTNEIDMDAIIKIFRPSRFANVRENVITVWKNGKPVFYEFRDKELLKAIMHLDTDAVTLFDKLARPFSQVLRVGATWNPRFIGFNPFRDNILSGIWGVAGYLPFVDLFRGVYHIAKKSDEYKDWLEAGGAMSTLNTWDRNYFKEYAGKYVEKKYYESVLRAINPIGWLGKASGVMEYATNIGQYVKAREKGAHPVAANFFGRDITVDHLRHGSQTHRIRAHIPFFNAWVQGTDKSWRAFKKNPTQFLFRALIMITLPTVVLYLINRRNPYYQELPSWRRCLFWNIPVPIGGSIRTTKYFIMLPRPFIPGLVFGGMVEYLMNMIDKENRAAWDDLAKDIFNTVLPNYTPAWLGPPLELWANTKIYSGAPVVPASEERLWPSDQYGPYTSEMAKKLGKALNTSPRKIDALVYGYTAGLGRYAVRGIDEILYLVGAADKEMRPAGTIQDIPLLGDIIVASGSYGPANLTRFYNDLRKAEKIAAKELKALERGEVISLTQKEQLYRNHLSALRSINRDLATLNRYIDEIYRNETLSRKEKREMLDYLELAKINKVRVAYGLDPIPTN